MKAVRTGYLLLAILPTVTLGDPAMECGTEFGSQVEIGGCVSEVEETVDKTIELAFSFAKDAAAELDQVTGRAVSVPALEAGQAAWSAYRDAHCEFVGSTYGGGSGTGIAIRSCRIDLGRARVSELMRYAQ